MTDAQLKNMLVAPYTGAWIEIFFFELSVLSFSRRSLHGSVD